MRTKRVYIAAPYSQPDPAVNILAAIKAAEEVHLRTDWLPFVPHLFHLWHLIRPRPYAFWMGMDLDWMRTCHALVRLSGLSKGADKEMDCAVGLGIPVFLSIDEFVEWERSEHE